MNNFFINRMKEVIDKFRNGMNNIDKNIIANNERYSKVVADKENAILEEEKKNLIQNAKVDIVNIFNTIKIDLGKASFPNVEELTADRMFFNENTPIELTTEQAKIFISKYKNNYTMLSVISSYIERNHNDFDEWITVKEMIPTPNKQVEEYYKISKSALSLIDTIITNPRASQIVIDSFCDYDNANFWHIIGDGMNLLDYGKSNVPVEAEHIFDKYNLNSEIDVANFKFDFSSNN